MKIMLIHPNLRKIILERGLDRFMTPALPPLGIAYLAAFLRPHGYEIRIVDAYAENLSEEEVFLQIKRFMPEVVGFSLHTEVMFSAKIAEKAKHLNHDIVTVVGGVTPSCIPQLVLERFPMFDFAVIGEGELSFYSLVKALEKKEPFNQIKGIAYRENSNVVLTPPRDYIQDLDTLPAPARDLIRNNLYGFCARGPVTLIEASRGCAGNCRFCCVGQMFGKIVRRRDPIKVIDEIEHCCNTYDIDFFSFVDNTFTEDKNYVYKITGEIIKRNLHKKIKWKCMTRVDCVDELILRKMKRAGCKEIGFGVEAPNQVALDFYRKCFTLRQTENAFFLAKKVGLRRCAIMIINQYNEEIGKVFNETIKFLKRLNSDYTIQRPLVVYPKTPLHKYYINKNSIEDANYDSFFKSGLLESKYIKFKDLIKLTNKIYFIFYFRISFILIVIKNIPSSRMINESKILLKRLFLRLRYT